MTSLPLRDSIGFRSQEDRILWVLQAAWPNWTRAPALGKISLQYNRAIHSLRHRDGWSIENRLRVVDGVRHGEFRLGSAAVPSSKELHKPKPEASSLFPGLKGAHVDDG